MRRLARPSLYLGTVAAVVGFAAAHARVHGYPFAGSSRFAWELTYIAALAVTAYGLGLPELPPGRSKLVTALTATGIAAGAMSVIQLVVGDALLPRFVVFCAAAVLVPWYVLCADMARDARSHAEDRDRVILVGEQADATALADDLDERPERPASLVATIAIDAANGDGPPSEPLVDLAIACDASVVVLSRSAVESARVIAQAAALHEAGIRVRSLASFYEQWLGKFPLAELERASLLFDIGELHRQGYVRVKRLLDFACGVLGTLALALLVPFVLFANLVGNRGPLLYRQPRVGRHGRRFEILKFRTMRTGPDAVGTEWTSDDDARVTAFGRVLRRTHLDELPQVLNILRGDLSVVGPRPEQPQYVERLATKLPFYDLRHLVRPGLTGWAQVKYPYGASQGDALEKLQYEFFYLGHQGLVLDLRIIGRTLRSVIGREGR